MLKVLIKIRVKIFFTKSRNKKLFNHENKKEELIQNNAGQLPIQEFLKSLFSICYDQNCSCFFLRSQLNFISYFLCI